MSQSRYPLLLSPLAVGAQTLRNRVVMGSMHTRLEHAPLAEQAAFYAERARGGVGLIVTGGVSPNRAGRIEDDGPTLERRDQLAPHAAIVAAVHAHGGKILLQVLHTGAYAKHDDIVGFSAIRSPINPRMPRMLSAQEIEATIEDYARCAALALEAGYDGVEIMGSEGYFLSQCVTARANARTDQFGGSLENRMRCPLEVVRRTRARLGSQPIVAYRMSALDLVERGQTAAEIITLARALEAAGADMLNTGIGWHEFMVPTIAGMVPRAAFAFATRRLKEAVAIPVMASNRINMPDVAEALLAAGDADLVSLARPLLADPDFVAKTAQGRVEEINTCIACNQACLDYIFSGQTASCLVNPRAGRETHFPPGPTARALNVAVVGGGAAGLSAAITAASRGHRVTLFEAAPQIGGQLLLARAVPGKSEFGELLRYFGVMLARHRITVHTGRRAAIADLQAFDRVVLATGVRPRRPDIPGLNHASVVFYDALLSGRATAGPRVAVIGTGGIGHDVALFLTADDHTRDPALFLKAWGVDPANVTAGGLAAAVTSPPTRQVTMLQRSQGRIGDKLGKTTGWIHRAELRRKGVNAIAGCRYTGIDDAGLHLVVDGAARTLAVDTVVVCAGQDSEQELAAALAGRPVDLIGGARLAGELDAVRAIDEGMRLAAAL